MVSIKTTAGRKFIFHLCIYDTAKLSNLIITVGLHGAPSCLVIYINKIHSVIALLFKNVKWRLQSLEILSINAVTSHHLCTTVFTVKLNS